jgi:peptide deformylase
VSLLPIHVLGSPILRVDTTPVAAVTDDLQKLIDEMFETMYAAQGIGLAAPQVGRSERLAVIDVGDSPLVIINPEIIHEEGNDRAEEGCLSIPDIYGDVDRSKRVVVRAMDREGATFEIEGTELFGRCLQHEIDHLHGKLFIDYLSFLKRRSALAKWEGLKEKYPSLLRHLTLEEIRAARAERASHPNEQI